MSNPRPRVLFVTSSMRTRWEIYSQAFLRRFREPRELLLLDGRSGWHPLNFVEPALRRDSDFIVLIDEDCFLVCPDLLDALLTQMQQEESCVAAGVPDGGTPYRSHNPYACNQYFCVFKTKALREFMAGYPAWRELRFDKNDVAGLSPETFPIEWARTSLDDFEPYYPLFWLLRKKGAGIRLLPSDMDPESKASRVRLDCSGKDMALHVWHLRQWFSRETDSEMGISPIRKFALVSRQLHRRIAADPGLLWEFVKALAAYLKRRRES